MTKGKNPGDLFQLKPTIRFKFSDDSLKFCSIVNGRINSLKIQDARINIRRDSVGVKQTDILILLNKIDLTPKTTEDMHLNAALAAMSTCASLNNVDIPGFNYWTFYEDGKVLWNMNGKIPGYALLTPSFQQIWVSKNVFKVMFVRVNLNQEP